MLKTEDRSPVAAAAERRPDRRRFLRSAGCAAAPALLGKALGARLEHARAAAPRHVRMDPATLAIGEQRAIADGDAETLVVRLDAATVVAFDRRCPHLGCPVLWSPERDRFECPCHHAAFDARSGRVLFGPPRTGLGPVRIV